MEDFSTFVGVKRPTESISIWVEKYRPTKLGDFVGNESVLSNVKNYLERGEITSHLLFHGPAGCGKTTIAKILVKNIPCDYLYVNASDETKIDDMRDKVKGFASSVGFNKFKVVILDESDFLSFNSQGLLRNMMETFAGHTRFILTCNYIYKIMDAIQSRCQKFEIIPNSKKDIMVRLATILKAESVKFKPEDVAFIVNELYPDMRSIIGFAQQCSINGELVIVKDNLVESDVKSKLVSMLTKPTKETFNEIRQMLADASSSPQSYDDYITHLYTTVNEYAKGREAMIIIDIAEAAYQSSVVIPKAKEIVFMALINKIILQSKG